MSGSPSEKRRILIFSASFGGGHKSAADAMFRYFKEHHADTVDVRVVDFFEEFMPGVNTLAKFAYQQSVAFFPELYGTFFEAANLLPSNPIVHELRIMGFQRATTYIDEFDPDAVISTFPVAGGVVSDIKAERPLVAATVVTDYGVHKLWLHPSTDLYFVATKEVREDLVVRGIPWDRVVVSGIPVHERFTQVISAKDARKEMGLSDRFTVLLTSAAGLSGEVRDIAAELVEAGIQVVAATGTHTRLKRRLDNLAKKSAFLKVFGYTHEMQKLMRSADVLVGKAGGLTVSESLAIGLPLIIYNPVPGQEIYNVDFLVNAGAGLLSRDESDVVDKVKFLAAHPARLEQMAGNALGLGKPAAAPTICERVLSAVR